MDNSNRYKQLQRVSLITIIVNAVLAAAKMLVGLVAGSVSVISDGVHTLSDVGTTIIVMIGLKFSKDDADEEHQYGHQKIESIVSLFLAIALGATALFIGYEGITKLISGERSDPSVLAIIVTVASIASKEWMYHFTKGYAKRLNSLSLMTDAWHHRTDSVSSIAVLIGVVGNMFGAWFLEPVAALAVSVMIVKAAIDILRDSFSQIVDHSVDQSTRDEFNKIALAVEGVQSIDDLRTRISGNAVFVDIDIAVNPDIPLHEAHDIAEKVHDNIEASSFNVFHCMVHVNPTEGN